MLSSEEMNMNVLFCLPSVIAVVLGACPFKNLNRAIETGITLENAPTAARARAIGESKYCGAPLCSQAIIGGTSNQEVGGRQLLSTVELRSNGYPELTSITVSAIQTDFCAILNGGCDTDNTGAYSGLTTDYGADLDR